MPSQHGCARTGQGTGSCGVGVILVARDSFKGCGRDSTSVWMEIHRNETFEKTVNDSDYQMGLYLGL